MCHAQGRNAVTVMRLEPAATGLESSTLPLIHCVPRLKIVRLGKFYKLGDPSWLQAKQVELMTMTVLCVKNSVGHDQMASEPSDLALQCFQNGI